MKTRTGHRAS